MSFKKQIFYVFLVAFIFAAALRVFVIEGLIVKGDSMAPAILSGDYVFINKLAYIFKEPSRGDIVVAIPRGESFKVIKRIAVLPGESFSDDFNLSRLDPEEYFVLGDNSRVSIDSRELGFIDSWDIKGRTFLIFRLRSFRFISL
ncbi:MAG: signal peptidase I [Parcubacteria group bacterium]